MAKKKRYGNFAEEVIQGTYKNVDTFSTNEYIEENIVQPTLKATESKTGLKKLDVNKYDKLKIGSNYKSDFTDSVLQGNYDSESDKKTYYSADSINKQDKENKKKKEKEIKDAFEKAKKGQKSEQELANDNLKAKQKEFDNSLNKYQKELSNAYKEEEISFDNRVGLSRKNDKISYQTKNKDKTKGTLNTDEQAPAIAKVFEKVKKSREKADEKLNELNFAKYQKNVADVNAEETNWYDKTIGNIVRGAADLGSIFDIESQKYTTPEGKEVFLPTKNELKQQKVSEDYNTGVGKFLGDVTYNVSKIGTSLAANTLTGGIGGTAAYWTDMYADNYKNAINEGYDKKNAIAYSTVGTAAEYATGKLLGSATKGLTGGKTSQLSSAISNTVNKFIKSPTISNFLGNAGSEATEEFVQEYVDNLNRLVTLEGSKNVDDYIDVFTDKDIFQDALYSAGVGALSGVASNITDGTGKTIKDNTADIRDFRNQLEQSKSETKDATKIEKYDQALSLVDDYLKNPFVNNGQMNTELANTYNQYQQQQLTPSALETGVQQFVQERATQDVNNRAIQNQVNAFNLGKNTPVNTNTLGNTETIPQGQETAQIKPSFVESAQKYNIKTDNDTIKSIDRVMSERGVNANFDDTLFKNSNVNALWRTNEDGTREVVFNPNANTNDLLENVAVHELYHDIVQQKGNNFLQDIVLDMASTKDDYINARNELLNEYAKIYDTNNPNFNNMVNEEAVASILGQKLGNQEFINELTTQKRSIAKVIYDNIVSLLNKLNKLTGYKSEKLYWTDVKNKFENAYRSTSTSSKKSDTKYSISSSTSDNKGRKLSKQQQDYFKDSKVRDDNGNLLVMYHGTLTNAEKKGIRKDIQAKLENGEIDFSTSKLSKKEISNIEKQVKDDLRKGYISTDAIEKTLGTDADLSLDAYLQRSYNEKSLRSKQFTYQTSDSDSEFRKELAKTTDVLNDTTRSHELFETVSKISEDTGTKYGFVNNEKLKFLGHDVEGKTINGLVRVNEDGTSKILINVDSDKALNTIIGHETTHLLEGTKEYQSLQNIVKEYAKNKGDYDSKYNQINSLYQGTNANVDNEVTSDLVGDYLFTDEEFVKNLSAKEPTVFQKVYDYIKHVYNLVTAGSKEQRELEKVKYRFEQAYNEMSKTTTQQAETNLTTESESNTIKYHISEKFSKDIDDMVRDVKRTMEQDVIDDQYIDELIYNSDSYREDDNDNTNYDEVRDALMEALEKEGIAGRYDEGKDKYIYDRQELAKKGYDELLNYLDKNNVNYEVSRSTEAGYVPSIYIKNAEGETIYRIANHDNGYVDDFDMVYNGAYNTLYSDKDYANWKERILPKIEKEIGSLEKQSTKYSLSDNQGRTLSKEQQEYFKDSKVRDDNGNLLVMYHGTPTGEFNTFKNGSYFTSNKKYADRYQWEGASSISYGKKKTNPKTYEVYLNITNPFTLSNKKAKDIYLNEYIKGGNSAYFDPYTDYTDTINNLEEVDWVEGEDLIDWLQENHPEFDGLYLDEGGDGGYGMAEYRWRGISVVSFNANQIKDIDNTNPTSTDDIRYSEKNPTWQEFVEKNFKNEGKGTKLQDLKEKPKKTVALSDVATKMKSGKTTVYSKDIKLTDEDIDSVFKTQKKEKVAETSKKVAKLTNQEKQELNALESVPFDLDETEQKKLDYLKSKQQGNIKHIDLVNKTSYDSIKKEYNKYKNQMETFNTKQLMSAEEVISANKQGRRTKNEWLDIAEHIGSNIKTDDSKALEKYAIQSFLYAKPNSKDNLNRQGQKYVKFTIEEWLDRVYKGAGVGEKYSVQGNGRGMEVTSKTSSEDIINRAKKKDGESKFYGNITERSKFLTEENRSKLAQEEDIKYYDKITNKESLDMAMKKLKEGGQNEIDNWFSRNNKETYDSTDVAEGWIMLKRAQDSGDYDMMVNVAKKMREMGTKSGQAIQMYNLLGRLTPEGMVKYATSELDDAWNIASKNKTKKWVNDNKNSFELTPDETKFIVDQMEKISTMEDGYEKNVEIAKVQKMLQDKLPPEKGQGLKAWMRISMLFNPKTQVRNILGNAVITPVNALADVVASRVDKSIAKKTGLRTSGTTSLKNYAKGFKKGLYESYNDFKQGISTRDIQGNRFEVGQGKSFNERHTGALAKQRNAVSKAFNRVDSMLGFLLDVGDRPFYETTFVNSINNQKILNNTNEITQDMLDIATNEALARTWQDNNEYTKFVLNVRRGMNKLNIKGYGLGDVLIPFAKTPANLTKAIVDYSPVGLVKTLTSDYRKLKNNISTGTVTSMQQHEFAQNLGKAVAGTMLYVAGYALAEAGIITGANDEDKDVSDFMKNTLGIQPYSVKIGDKSFTYDWAQPVAAPFAVMADLKNVDKGTGMLEAVNSVTDTAFNILLEQSFLTGIQDVLGSYGSKVEGIENQIFSLPARAVPTFVKQINDLIDPYSRMVYEQDKQLESAKNQVKTKIPGVSKELPVTRDTLGRKVEKYGGDNNIFNVFFNPANTSKGKVSESAKEIYKVYEATKDKDIMPRYPSSSLKLNNKQKSQFLKISGTIIEDNVKELRNSTYYKMLDDEDKAATIKGIVDYAYNKAKSEVTGSEISNLYKTADKKVISGVSLYDYYAKKTYNSK